RPNFRYASKNEKPRMCDMYVWTALMRRPGKLVLVINPDRLARVVKRIVKRAGGSYAAAARQVGCTYVHVSRLARGKLPRSISERLRDQLDQYLRKHGMAEERR